MTMETLTGPLAVSGDTIIIPIMIAISAAYIASLFFRPLAHAALATQAAYTLWRGMELGRLPLTGTHDTLSFLSLACMAFGLGVMHAMKRDGMDMRDRNIFIKAMALMAGAFATIAAFNAPKGSYLPPILNTYWFELHVAMSFFSYALFAIAFVLGGLFLLRGIMAYEKLQYKTALIGYALFSISMIFGGVWAHLAWGTYWLWTPKELWTSLLWIFYGLYLHVRLHPPLYGRPAAVMGMVGYAVVLFTYLGVSLLMKSSHTF